MTNWREGLARTAELIWQDLSMWPADANYSTMPRTRPPEQRWKPAFIRELRVNAHFWKWAEVHIVDPLDKLHEGWQETNAANKAQVIRERLNRLIEVLRNGWDSTSLLWEVETARPGAAKSSQAQNVAESYAVASIPGNSVAERMRVVPHTIDESTKTAAVGILAEIAQWRAAVKARKGALAICFVPRNGASVARTNPGPSLSAADLDIIASAGSVAAAMVERLRSWSDTDNAEVGGPADALGFLHAVAADGSAIDMNRWAPVMAARPAISIDVGGMWEAESQTHEISDPLRIASAGIAAYQHPNPWPLIMQLPVPPAHWQSKVTMAEHALTAWPDERSTNGEMTKDEVSERCRRLDWALIQRWAEMHECEGIPVLPRLTDEGKRLVNAPKMAIVTPETGTPLQRKVEAIDLPTLRQAFPRRLRTGSVANRIMAELMTAAEPMSVLQLSGGKGASGGARSNAKSALANMEREGLAIREGGGWKRGPETFRPKGQRPGNA